MIAAKKVVGASAGSSRWHHETQKKQKNKRRRTWIECQSELTSKNSIRRGERRLRMATGERRQRRCVLHLSNRKCKFSIFGGGLIYFGLAM